MDRLLIFVSQFDPLAGPAARWLGEHLDQMGVRQGAQHAVPLAVIHELGTPGELALGHASGVAITQDLQGAFVVGLDLVFGDARSGFSNCQLGAVARERNTPVRIVVLDLRRHRVPRNGANQGQFGGVLLDARQDR